MNNNDDIKEYTLKVRDMEISVTRKILIKFLLAITFIIGSYVILVTMATILPAGLLMLQGIVTLIVMIMVVLKLWEYVEFEGKEEKGVKGEISHEG